MEFLDMLGIVACFAMWVMLLVACGYDPDDYDDDLF